MLIYTVTHLPLGAVLETQDIDNTNIITIGNYSYFYSDEIPSVIVCRSGLLLPDDNSTFLGEWYYNNQPVGGFGSCGADNPYLAIPPSESNPGVLAIVNCHDLTLQSEGLYTCIIQDTDFTVHELKVGLYFNRGGVYICVVSTQV